MNETKHPAGEHLATVEIYRRPDGGFRVISRDPVGIFLSGLDANQVSHSIIPAALALNKRRQKE
jgi:hypothetical protein